MEQKNKWHPETPKECTERNEQIVKALIDDPKWKNRAKKIQNCDKYDPCMYAAGADAIYEPLLLAL